MILAWASLSIGLAQSLVSSDFEHGQAIFDHFVKEVGRWEEPPKSFVFVRDGSLGSEGFRIERGSSVRVVAADEQGLVWGLQELRDQFRGREFSVVEVEDRPAFPFRSFLADVARRFHSIDTLKKLVVECSEARVGQMYLHLTDDQNWMFPTEVLAGIEEGNTHGKPTYTVAELKELQEFALVRGVRLVPEIDLPGHSSLLVRHDPELFGITGSPSRGCIDFASPEVRAKLKLLYDEVMAVFDESPYFHLGGDEAWYPETEGDADFVAAFERLGEGANATAVFAEFIGEMADYVLSKGKTPVVWEGFGRTPWAKRFIPDETIVIAWEGHYHAPDQLMEDGWRVVNAGWDPLYVVDHYPRDNFTMVGLNRILNFDPWTMRVVNRQHSVWEWTLPKSGRLEGAMMCWWEGVEENAMRFLPDRIQAFGWRMWTGVDNPRGLEPPEPGRSEEWPVPEPTVEHLARGAMVSAEGTVDGFGADRLVDGVVDRLAYWMSFPSPTSATVDLGFPTEVSGITVVTFWDGAAVSRYRLEVSLDGEEWSTVADASRNERPATEGGYIHAFTPRQVRYVRVTAMGNSKFPPFTMSRIVELIVR